MKSKKATKRALLTSAMSLVLCFTMLLGSTYAWFTDEAKTGVNTIQSGTLDVVLEYKDASGNWADANGKTLDFIKADGSDEILWEPGCTYKLPAIRVGNNGNLKLKYEIVITGIDGDAKLNEAIEWTYTANGGVFTEFQGKLDAATATGTNYGDYAEGIVISGHMKEDAGNEYQNLTIDGISITVYATQVEGEFDSFEDDYDENAGDNYGKTNVGPYKLSVLSDGIATYDEVTKTYSIAVNTVAQGGYNANQGGKFYAGYTVNVAGYGENATVKFDKAGGTTTTWKLADEERDGFINGGVHQQWTSVGTSRAYRYDIDGDGVTDFTVVNDVSNAGVATANAEELEKVLEAGSAAVLTADINMGDAQITIPAGASAVLDLNGHDLTGTYTGDAHYAMFTIPDGASLTINGEGDVTATTAASADNRSLALFQNSGELVLNGGNYKVTDNSEGKTWIIATIVDNRTSSTSCATKLTINGGDYSVAGKAINLFRNYPQQGGSATLIINDGNFYGEAGETTYIWNQEAGTHLGELYFNGGNYDANVVYEDYNGQSDVHITDGVIISGYSGNN